MPDKSPVSAPPGSNTLLLVFLLPGAPTFWMVALAIYMEAACVDSFVTRCVNMCFVHPALGNWGALLWGGLYLLHWVFWLIALAFLAGIYRRAGMDLSGFGFSLLGVVAIAAVHLGAVTLLALWYIGCFGGNLGFLV